VTVEEADLTEDERRLLDELADGIARRRLTSAAMFFLESVKPMGYVGSQMMLFLRPMVSVVWSNPTRWDQLQQVLEKRGSIELLLRRLEARA
jgi:hypothetical protein